MHQSEIDDEENISDDESEVESKQESEVDEQESDSEVSNDDEENEPWIVDVWKQMRDEADSTDTNFLDIYKDNVTFAKSLAQDETHKKVMETFKKAQTEDDMDFVEALDFAVDRRKFLIQREFEDDSDVRYTLNDNEEDVIMQ